MRCVLFLVEGFSEWDNICQQCKFYKNCLEQEAKESAMSSNSDKTFGDFPNHDTIHLRLLIHEERTKLIQKLLHEDLSRITKDDIIDVIIDVELYNIKCKKQRIKKCERD